MFEEINRIVGLRLHFELIALFPGLLKVHRGFGLPREEHELTSWVPRLHGDRKLHPGHLRHYHAADEKLWNLVLACVQNSTRTVKGPSRVALAIQDEERVLAMTCSSSTTNTVGFRSITVHQRGLRPETAGPA